MSGDGSTLAYGVTSVDYQDEAGCLAGTDSCAMKIVQGGGGVYRVVGGQKLRLVPGTTAAVAVAVWVVAAVGGLIMGPRPQNRGQAGGDGGRERPSHNLPAW